MLLKTGRGFCVDKGKDGEESDVRGEHIHLCSVCFITESGNRLKLAWEIQQAQAIHNSWRTPLCNTEIDT